MSAPHALDEANLSRYLTENLPGFQGPLKTTKFSGGQSNPTFLLESPMGQWVLRRKPPGQLLKSAHAVDREYRVMAALANSDVPVPKAHLLCEDESVIGSVFFIMSYEQGRIFWDPAMPEVERPEREAIYADFIRILAAIHDVDVEAVGLGDFGKPGNYFQRQINRWTGQYRAAETERQDDMEALMEWLPSRVPEDDGQSGLIHGDYRGDNIIVHGNEPRGIAVLDWELSTLGHPFADLAYFCMGLRTSVHGRLAPLTEERRAELGVPLEQDIVSRYCDLRGIDAPTDWSFYMAFCMFRMAAIVQGVKKRALDGNASNRRAMEIGTLTPVFAREGAALIN